MQLFNPGLLKLTDKAIESAVSLGLCDSFEDTGPLRDKIRFSVPVSNHPLATRRTGDWFFKLKDNVLLGVFYIDCLRCQDFGTVVFYNECPKCEGDGCSSCVRGEIKSRALCPECGGKYVPKAKKIRKFGRKRGAPGAGNGSPMLGGRRPI